MIRISTPILRNIIRGNSKVALRQLSFSSQVTSYQRINQISGSMMGRMQVNYHFTTSGDPTQVQLLEEVEAKVFQVLKSAAKCDQKKLSRTASF